MPKCNCGMSAIFESKVHRAHGSTESGRTSPRHVLPRSYGKFSYRHPPVANSTPAVPCRAPWRRGRSGFDVIDLRLSRIYNTYILFLGVAYVHSQSLSLRKQPGGAFAQTVPAQEQRGGYL